MHTWRTGFSSACLAAAMVLTPLTQASFASCVLETGHPWKVEGLAKFTKSKYARNLSGLACAPASGGQRTCVLVQDEDYQAAIVTLTEGRLDIARTFELKRVTPPPDKDHEYDAEAAAYSAGLFYVLGSHSRRGKACNEANPDSRMLTRFALDAATGLPAGITVNGRPIAGLISLIPALAPKFDRCLGTKRPPDARGEWVAEQGINFEGLAVRGEEVFLGLRGPVLNGAAHIIRTTLPVLFGGAEAEATATALKLSPAGGVRDLAVHEQQILILSGSEDDDIGNAAIHVWNGSGTTVTKLCDIPRGDQENDKPEALLVLDGTASAFRVLILSDGPVGGNPRVFTIRTGE